MRKNAHESLHKHLDLSNEESLYLLIFIKCPEGLIKFAATNCVCGRQRCSHPGHVFLHTPAWMSKAPRSPRAPRSAVPTLPSPSHFHWDGPWTPISALRAREASPPWNGSQGAEMPGCSSSLLESVKVGCGKKKQQQQSML